MVSVFREPVCSRRKTVEKSLEYRPSPWPHRLAVALALVTFPLIWVGGLVTTYDAGMAVPDWPGTYGYNLFRYPWQTWIAGPWDLFIEHGHRLLGATAGMVAIALVAVVWLTDRRLWLIWASVGALALVVLQGVLGGARVHFDERQIALLHGCVGPLFFAYLASLAVATSEWFAAVPTSSAEGGARFMRHTWIVVMVAFAQLVLGATLRHVPLTAGAGLFRAALWLHLLVAGALTFLTLMTCVRSASLRLAPYRASRFSALLLLLVAIQIGLGAGTYIMKYAFPVWLQGYDFAAGYVVQEKSLAQSFVTTAHVATGALILFVAALQATAATRVFFPSAKRWQRNTVAVTAPILKGRAAA